MYGQGVAFTSIESRYLPRICLPSRAPLYSNRNPHDAINIILKSNFDHVNDSAISVSEHKDQTKTTGTFSYNERKLGKGENIPVTVVARGNYRFEECDIRPLSIHVIRKVKKGIKKSQDWNIFKKEGKKLKLYLQCSDDPDFFEKERRKLLQEYYLYVMQGTLRSLSLQPRLAKVTLLNLDGSKYSQIYGFFLESKKKLAKRCGMKKEELFFYRFDRSVNTLVAYRVNAQKQPVPYYPQFNPTSMLQIKLWNKFIRNEDYEYKKKHNVARLVLASTNEVFLAPFDYDLSYLIKDDPEYVILDKYSQFAERFLIWLRSLNEPHPIIVAQIHALLQRKEKMLKIIFESLLDEQGKQTMIEWLETFMESLSTYQQELQELAADHR